MHNLAVLFFAAAVAAQQRFFTEPALDAPSVEVASGRSLVAAWADDGVGAALVTTDIVLTDDDFTGLPLPLVRGSSFRVVGTVAARPYTLNFNFVRARVRMSNLTVLQFEHLLLTNYRSGSTNQAPGLDVMAPMPPGQLALIREVHAVYLYRWCFPPAILVQAASMVVRPPMLPGNNTYLTSIPWPANCTNDTTAFYMDRCYVNVGKHVDFAGLSADLDATGKPVLNGYVMNVLDALNLCENNLSNECLVKLGPLGCLLYMQSLSPPPPVPPAPPSVATDGAGGVGANGKGGDGGTSSHTGTVLAAVLGSALGVAVAVLICVVVVLVAKRRRQQQQGKSESGGQGGLASWCCCFGYCCAAGGGGGAGYGTKKAAAGGGDGGDDDDASDDQPAPVGKSKSGTTHTLSTKSTDLTASNRPPVSSDSGCAPLPPSTAGSTALEAPGNAGVRQGVAAAAAAAAAAAVAGAANGNGSDGGCGGSTAAGEEYGGGEHPVVTELTPRRPSVRLDVRLVATPPGGPPPPPPPPPLAGVAAGAGAGGGAGAAAGAGAGAGAGAEVRLLGGASLGRGAFGQVLRAQFQGAVVAVKVVADVDQWAGPAEALLRSFAQEVEVLARCDHPNVVKLLAACLQPPRLCLVMELMEMSLERLLYGTPGRLLPLATVLHVGVEVARGLEYLHPTILHRDLKPANVLLNASHSERPEVKITDFGLSRLRSTVLLTQHPDAGTPGYMAPECYDVTAVKAITHKADVFSLGVLLWEMLAGQRPFGNREPLAIAQCIADQRLRPSLARLSAAAAAPSAAAGGGSGAHQAPPPELLALIAQCWEHDPRRRPAAAEVAKDLQRLLREQESSPAARPRPDAAAAAAAAAAPADDAAGPADKRLRAMPPPRPEVLAATLVTLTSVGDTGGTDAPGDAASVGYLPPARGCATVDAAAAGANVANAAASLPSTPPPRAAETAGAVLGRGGGGGAAAVERAALAASAEESSDCYGSRATPTTGPDGSSLLDQSSGGAGAGGGAARPLRPAPPSAWLPGLPAAVLSVTSATTSSTAGGGGGVASPLLHPRAGAGNGAAGVAAAAGAAEASPSPLSPLLFPRADGGGGGANAARGGPAVPSGRGGESAERLW